MKLIFKGELAGVKTKIILERHGESMANATNSYAGHSNYPLSELGFRQADLAAEALGREHIDAVYSSDLDRTYSTALPHALRRGLKVEKCECLREMYIGEWEGKTKDHLVATYPYEADFIWNNYFGIFRAPGGESAPAAAERFYSAVEQIAKRNEGKTVLIAAHAAVIRLFFAKIRGLACHEVSFGIPFPTNASFSYVEYDGEKFIPGDYSVDTHIRKADLQEIINE